MSRPSKKGELVDRATNVGSALQPRDEANGQIGVVHIDVDLETADQVLVDEEAVVLLHATVPTERGELEVGAVRERRGSCRGHGQALVGGRGHQILPEPLHLL